MKMKVLGPGCMNCINLENRTKEAVKDLKLDASLEKVIDYTEILSYGVVRTPALLIDNNIAVQGKVPNVDELTELLKNYTNK